MCVIFHEETDSVDKQSGGQNHVYSFIYLAPTFFESSKTSVLEKDTKLENIRPADKVNVLAKDTKLEKIVEQTASTRHDIRHVSKHHQRIPRHSSIVLN